MLPEGTVMVTLSPELDVAVNGTGAEFTCVIIEDEVGQAPILID